MVQHLSIRVPWHDHGWDGNVCADLESNNACLRLKNISDNKDDSLEASICGQYMSDHADSLSCIGEGACFMSPQEIIKSQNIHTRKAIPPHMDTSCRPK